MKNIDLIATVLLVVAGLNMGMVTFFNYDMLAQLVGASGTMHQVLYGAVGLSGLYYVLNWAKAKCSKSG